MLYDKCSTTSSPGTVFIVWFSISVSEESDSSSVEESEESENDVEPSNDEADVESDAESEAKSDDENALVTNEGWADSVAKILGSSKPKNKKTLVLSRAKKHSEIVKKEKEEKPAFEVIGETSEQAVKKDVKTEDDSEEPPVKKVVGNCFSIISLLLL